MITAILILNLVILAVLIVGIIDIRKMASVQRESLEKYKARRKRYEKEQEKQAAVTIDKEAADKAAVTIEDERAADKESGNHGY